MSSMKRRRAERSARSRAGAGAASVAGSAAGRADVIAIVSLLSGHRGLRSLRLVELRARTGSPRGSAPSAAWYRGVRPPVPVWTTFREVPDAARRRSADLVHMTKTLPALGAALCA